MLGDSRERATTRIGDFMTQRGCSRHEAIPIDTRWSRAATIDSRGPDVSLFVAFLPWRSHRIAGLCDNLIVVLHMGQEDSPGVMTIEWAMRFAMDSAS
jgi:hypothetical protein